MLFPSTSPVETLIRVTLPCHPVCRILDLLCRLITQEREAKRQYKEAFEALAKAKAKMVASANQEEGLRRDLIDLFDSYLEAKVGAASS